MVEGSDDTLTNEALIGFIAVVAQAILAIDQASPQDRSTSRFLDHLETRLEWLIANEPLLLLGDEATIRKLHAILLRQIDRNRRVPGSS